MRVIGVIPARYGSSRFPGKPLVEIAGKTMIERVYERAGQAKTLDEIVVATDDERIYDTVRSAGGRAVMTSADCATGLDRVAEVAAKYSAADIIVNIQGDEPLLEPQAVDLAVRLIGSTPVAEITTLVRPEAPDGSESNDPNRVKAVLAADGRVLYFSRCSIPHGAGGQGFQRLIHIGMYVYRNSVLQRVCRLERSALEKAESLEQLRALEAGVIFYAAAFAGSVSIGVDTPEDIARVEREIYRLGL